MSAVEVIFPPGIIAPLVMFPPGIIAPLVALPDMLSSMTTGAKEVSTSSSFLGVQPAKRQSDIEQRAAVAKMFRILTISNRVEDQSKGRQSITSTDSFIVSRHDRLPSPDDRPTRLD